MCLASMPWLYKAGQGRRNLGPAYRAGLIQIPPAPKGGAERKAGNNKAGQEKAGKERLVIRPNQYSLPLPPLKERGKGRGKERRKEKNHTQQEEGK